PASCRVDYNPRALNVTVSVSQLLKDLVVAAVVIFGGIYILLTITSTSRQAAPSQVTASSSVPIGSEGRINNGNPSVSISIDQDLKGKGPVFFVSEDTEI